MVLRDAKPAAELEESLRLSCTVQWRGGFGCFFLMWQRRKALLGHRSSQCGHLNMSLNGCCLRLVSGDASQGRSYSRTV
jgi:hypothetical protein